MGFILSIWCGKRGAEGGKRVFPPARLFWENLRKNYAPNIAHQKSLWCVFGVVLAQGKSPCSEATTDEAVFLLQFCFWWAITKKPTPFSGMGSIRPARHLKGPLSGSWDKLKHTPCKGRKGPSACVFELVITSSENACIFMHPSAVGYRFQKTNVGFVG